VWFIKHKERCDAAYEIEGGGKREKISQEEIFWKLLKQV
jgi:hypothetical protein